MTLICQSLSIAAGNVTESISGTVFEDLNADGIMGQGEKGIGGIQVSNGADIVLTRDDGSFELKKHTSGTTRIFVTLPENWKVTTDFSCVPENGKAVLFGLKRTAKQTVPYTFIDGGDMQYDLVKNLKQLHTDVRQLAIFQKQGKAVFSVWPGDLTQYGLKENLKAFKQAFSGGKLKFYPVFGGHDGLKSAPRKSSAYLQEIGPLAYSWNYGNINFIALVSEPYFLSRREKEEQKLWLKKHLGLLPPKTKIILVTHFPDELDIDINKEIQKAGHKLIAVLQGHWHCHNFFYADGIPVICSAPWRWHDWGAFTKKCRFITWDGKKLSSSIRVLGQNKRLIILSPQNTSDAKSGLLIAANVYDTLHEPDSVSWRILRNRKIIASGELKQKSDWTWLNNYEKNIAPGEYRLEVSAKAENITWKSGKTFTVEPDERHDGMILNWIYSSGCNSAYFSAPVIDEKLKRIFIGLGDGQIGAQKAAVACIDMVSGRQIWITRTKDDVNSTVALYKNRVYALSNGGTLFCMSKQSGEIIWKRNIYNKSKLPSFGWRMNMAPVLVYKGKVYIVGSTHENEPLICKYDAGTGIMEWRKVLDKGAFFQCGGVAVSSGKVYITRPSSVTALDENNGREIWSAKVEFSRGVGTSYADGKYLYVPFQKMLYKIDSGTGKIIWESRTGGNYSYMASVLKVNDKLILGHGEFISAFDKNTGNVVWRLRTVPPRNSKTSERQIIQNTSVPAVIDSSLYVASDNGVVYCIDIASGKIKERYEIGVPVKASVKTVGNMVIVSAFDGNIYSFKADVN